MLTFDFHASLYPVVGGISVITVRCAGQGHRTACFFRGLLEFFGNMFGLGSLSCVGEKLFLNGPEFTMKIDPLYCLALIWLVLGSLYIFCKFILLLRFLNYFA